MELDGLGVAAQARKLDGQRLPPCLQLSFVRRCVLGLVRKWVLDFPNGGDKAGGFYVLGCSKHKMGTVFGGASLHPKTVVGSFPARARSPIVVDDTQKNHNGQESKHIG